MTSTGLNIGTKPARTLGAVPLDYLASKVTGIRTRSAAEAPAEIYGWFKGMPSFVRATAKRARQVREIDEIYGGAVPKAVPGQPGAFTEGVPMLPGIPGKLIRWAHKPLSAMDQWYYDRVFHGEMWKMAERQAAFTKRTTQDVMDEQFKLVEKINKVESQADDIRKSIRRGEKPTREQAASLRSLDTEADLLHEKAFVRKAAFMAEKTIFTSREGEALDKSLDALDLMARHSILIDGILPFRRTVANVVRETLRGSPVGMVGAVNRAMQSRAAGLPVSEIQGRFVDDMSQAILGTGIMYTFLKLAESGYLEANPYKEAKPAERATEEAAGILPNTVRIGDWTIPVSRLEPFGAYILDAARAVEAKRGPNPPDGPIEEVIQSTQNLALLAAKENFLDPFAEFAEALQDDKSLARYMQNLGGSFVPRAISQFDPTIRETKEPSFVAGVKSKVPGAGEAKLGLFGEERKSQAPVMSFALGRSGKVGRNPTAQEMVRVGAYHSPPSGFSPAFKEGLSRKKIGYTDDEDRTLRMTKGRIQEMMVQRVIQSPGYAQLPQGPAGDMMRKRLIDKAFEEASKAVDARAKALKLAKVPLTERGILGQ